MAVRIKDVAREANVSVATVSRVINNVPLVNEETKKEYRRQLKEQDISQMLLLEA